MQYRSNNPDRGAPVGIEERGRGDIECGMILSVPIQTEGIKECLPQRWSAVQGAIDCRMEEKRVNLGWGEPSGIEEHLF